MTGKEIFKWIQDNHLEDSDVDRIDVCGAYTKVGELNATYFLVQDKQTGEYITIKSSKHIVL